MPLILQTHDRTRFLDAKNDPARTSNDSPSFAGGNHACEPAKMLAVTNQDEAIRVGEERDNGIGRIRTGYVSYLLYGVSEVDKKPCDRIIDVLINQEAERGNQE